MTTTTTKTTKPTRGWIAFVASLAALIAGIAAIGFVLSFQAEVALARSAGVDPALAWGWPVAVDGLTVVSTAVFTAFRSRNRGIARYALGLLIAATVVAILANAGHAVDIQLADAGLVAVGVVPPLAVLGSVHELGLVIGVLWVARVEVKAAAENAERKAAEKAARASEPAPAISTPAKPKWATPIAKPSSGSLYDIAVEAIERFRAANDGRMPSTSELAIAAGISVKSAQRHRNRLLAERDDQTAAVTS